MKRVFFIGLVVAVAAMVIPMAGTYWSGRSLLPWLDSRLPDLESIDQAAFQGECVEVANEWRRKFDLRALDGDGEIQESLRRLVEGGADLNAIGLDGVFEHVQATVPNASSLSASLVHATGAGALKEKLGEWDDVVIEEYEYLSTWLFVDDGLLGCLIVMAEKIPAFTLANLSRGGGTFHNVCRRCDHRHAVQIRDVRRTIVLSCPSCGKEYDLIAYDTEGRYRRAPDFLTKFSMPGSGRGEAPESEEAAGAAAEGEGFREVFRIWSSVREKCRYEYDASHARAVNEEQWKTPDETFRTGTGDCEDTSILLADALLSAGYPAKVAIGWNRNVGEHAWCVVLVDGEQVLLETTGGKPKDDGLPRVRDVGENYEPRQLFDRDYVYFRVGRGASFDYWSEGDWDKVDYGVDGGVVAKR